MLFYFFHIAAAIGCKASSVMDLLLVMESVLRKAGVYRTIFQKKVQLLAYADDIDIIERTMRYWTGIS